MTTATAKPADRTQVLIAYAVLYLVWGSTYLAMKMAVTTLPPFTTAALRFIFSGLLLLGVGVALDRRPITRAHLVASMGQGVLLLVFGNAAVMFAMKTVPSGTGALIIATTPLFMALLGRAFAPAKNDVSAGTWAGIVLGLVGIGVLVNPFGHFDQSHAVSLFGSGLLVFAAFSWAVGSLLPTKLPPHPSNLVATGIQMITGAVVQFAIGQVMGEHIVLATTSTSSWLALAYLAVFGSLVGFTCYGWLLKVEPASRVATYAYVNPVVAVFLGAVIGGEDVSARVIIAAFVIVVAVVLILRSKR